MRGARLSFAGAWLLVSGAQALAQPAKEVRLDGYAEWRRGEFLIVDGQRVRASSQLRFRGEGGGFAAIPPGHEVKVKGVRLADGTVLAREVEARPNGQALFEADLKSAFDEEERKYLKSRRVFATDSSGRITQDMGKLETSGPEVERVRAISARLVPPDRSPEEFRAYVVDNKEWNAMAAPNGSIFVFSGLLAEMDDDEVAIVLGHELVHATHEHSRKQFKKDLLIQLAALGVVAGAESIDSGAKRVALQAVAVIGATAWQNGYGRSHEDQADRVGLRYAYEAGYDVRRGPALWNRFARKYGEGNKVVNFFLSDHSMAKVRAANLEREVALNYR